MNFKHSFKGSDNQLICLFFSYIQFLKDFIYIYIIHQDIDLSRAALRIQT